MRDRIERKARASEAKRSTSTGLEKNSLSPLLELQRSAGNAAVVAMLGGDGPAGPEPSTSGLQVGAVDDRAEVDADQLADRALRRSSLDTSAFVSAPEPLPHTSSALDEPIRRLWDKSSMDRETFEELIRGPGAVEDTVHERILDRFALYQDALEVGNWTSAGRHLESMKGIAVLFLRTDPSAIDETHPAIRGLNRFIHACKQEERSLASQRDEQMAARDNIRAALGLPRTGPQAAAGATSSTAPKNPAVGSTSSAAAASASAGTTKSATTETGRPTDEASSEHAPRSGQAVPLSLGEISFDEIWAAVRAGEAPAASSTAPQQQAAPAGARLLVPPAIAALREERRGAQPSGSGPTSGQPAADANAALEDQAEQIDPAEVMAILNGGASRGADDEGRDRAAANPFFEL